MVLKRFEFWIVGDSPLICHAWSEKHKREMLQKQVKAVRGSGREARDPEGDFVSSLYSMTDVTEITEVRRDDKGFGFPATGVKKALLSAAHKDKGIAKSVTQSSLWLNCEWTRVKTAWEAAICTLPLVRIWGAEPVMREDMVRIGQGLKKTASLAYRAQFFPWAMRLNGRFNETELSGDALAFLIEASGLGVGLGEWRNERSGMFGSYHFATEIEERLWTAYADGKGPLPEAGLAEAAE
jgi:hypothetical protein